MKKSNPHKSYPDKVERYVKKQRKSNESKKSDRDQSKSTSKDQAIQKMNLKINGRELTIKSFQVFTKEELFEQINNFIRNLLDQENQSIFWINLLEQFRVQRLKFFDQKDMDFHLDQLISIKSKNI